MPARLRRAAVLVAVAAAGLLGLTAPAAAAPGWQQGHLQDGFGPEGGLAVTTPATPAGRTCGTTTQAAATTVPHTISSGGRDRTVQLRLPAGYDGRKQFPLLLVFHGRGSTGGEIQAFSGMDRLPAVVAYAEGIVGTGDGNRQAWQGAPYAAPGVDDVAFTRDLVADLSRSLCLDRSRVYATGKSNGGGFAGLLACRASDLVAAVAPVAAADYPETTTPCAPRRPVPVIAFHGTADATIPYGGDADRGLPALKDWAAGWGQRDGCHAPPRDTATPPDVTETRWLGCASGTEVALVSVAGGGHTWPGADAYSGGGVATQTIEATDVLWTFVSRYRLQQH